MRRGDRALLDVRSEGEFALGSVPGFVNLPILTNEERHLVGLEYKTKGQESATALGHRLVGPTKSVRIERWQQQIKNTATRSGLVSCWRGGMRSQLASEWMSHQELSIERIDGGYKAIRGALVAGLQTPPPFLVLAGMTGSGKTDLIRSLPQVPHVDLEQLALHRGSSFGKLVVQQPSQATFENALGLALWRKSTLTLVEDESAAIGRVILPKALSGSIAAAPVVVLEIEQSLRALHIYKEYVEAPLTSGTAPDALCQSLCLSIRAISRRLGGELSAKLEAAINQACGEDSLSFAHHENWILELLDGYYDKAYRHAFDRLKRPVLFRGNHLECEQWILHQFA